MEFKPSAGIVERGWVELTHPLPSSRYARQETGLLEYTEVFRHCRKGKRIMLRELTDGRLPPGQALKDIPTGRIN